jgi:hypothetical protein
MFAADPKTDVEGAYAAWDAAFNKGDAKSIAEGRRKEYCRCIPGSVFAGNTTWLWADFWSKRTTPATTTVR